MLEPGALITVEVSQSHSVPATVGKLIGHGGQGSVFEVTAAGYTDAVVKWYNDFYAEHFYADQLQTIRDLLALGAPAHGYLWPRSLAFATGNGSFGYIMDKRPAAFEELQQLVTGPASDAISDDARIAFALQVVAALQELHTAGFAYRDINLGNFFMRPASGEALICDTDNIGAERRPYIGVRGKDEFMAPEIVRGHANPSSNTDRHSLAVLLFILFLRWHPLEGASTKGLLDDEAQLRNFGLHPRFCLNPDNPSNRPPDDEAAHVRLFWRWYPARLRRLFIQSFTKGLDDPQHGRVMESDWLETLVSLRDSMMTCATCGRIHFHDPTEVRTCRRPGCGASYDAPTFLDVRLGHARTRSVVVSPKRPLFGYHLHAGYDALDRVAQIVDHPHQPGLFALHNMSGEDWEARFADGEIASVTPGDGCPLEPGISVRAGNARIELRNGAIDPLN